MSASAIFYRSCGDGYAEVARIENGTVRIHEADHLSALKAHELAELVRVLMPACDALERILDADDEGDGHEMIHALRDARRLLGRPAST